MKKQLYIFSGLGADERVFQRLDFSDFSTTFIKWIEPKEKDTIETYATRLRDQITSPNPVIIGLSFGGMLAVEVAKQITVDKVIIIASVKIYTELPFYYRFAGKLNLHKCMPTSILKRSNFFTNWFFGTNSTLDKQMLKQILIDTDATFLKWAIGQIVVWKNQTVVKDIIHIHGSSDRILPIKHLNCDIVIENGGHLMTLNKAHEMNTVLKHVLQ